MASAGFPLPPDVVKQQQPGPEQSVFSAQPGGAPPGAGNPGAGNPGQEVLQQIQAGIQELDQWASKMKTLLDGYDKSLSVFLQPIAQAGLEMGKAVTEKAQRSGAQGGSPTAQSPPAGAAAGMPTPRG